MLLYTLLKVCVFVIEIKIRWAIITINDYSHVFICSYFLQELRHKILGFERRTHTVTNGSYRYGENTDTLRKLGYSMVLSTNFILHKAYLEMFQIPEFLPKGIYRYVDVKMNCEDFAMAIMVTDFFERVSSPQSCCIVLKGKRFPYNLEEENG